jgi:predicted TIM-barrel fold metal-dependent hydrolase
MIPIIDAHHHIWRQSDLAWLSGPMQPRIFGPYEAIRRDYPISEFQSDLAGTGVVGSIYVQANWPVLEFESEVAWVSRVAAETGWPHAIVGYADLTVEDARPALDRLARYPLMRGIRMQLHWHENVQYRFASRADLVADPHVMRNVKSLASYGWAFDLQVFASQMTDAARLAESCPEVTLVLQHAGMLEDLSPAGRAVWRNGMRQLAACPNVVSKLSGLGTFLHANDATHIADVARETLGLFGPDRCLFGSNFPIEKLWCRYDELVAAHRGALMHLSAGDQARVLAGTAARVYRLGLSALT